MEGQQTERVGSRVGKSIAGKGIPWARMEQHAETCHVGLKKKKEQFTISYSDSPVTKRLYSMFALLCFNTQYLIEFL